MSSGESQQGLVVGVILLLILSLGASMLFLFAFVLWFAEILDSLTLSLTITGSALSLFAFLIYRVSLHPTLRQIKSDLETISQLASTIRCGYRWALGQFSNLLASPKKGE